jgi:hypothetical protein
MINNIPNQLYRGDADHYKVRNLKYTIGQRQLQTNLLNGGMGHVIFDTPITDLIRTHVDPGWSKTHFLSFSENRTTALAFGIGCKISNVPALLEGYEEYYENGENWDFVLIELNNAINWKQPAPGFFTGSFIPELNMFKILPWPSKVILINVVEALSTTPSKINDQALFNAKRDQEWLLLPATPIALNGNKFEFSGIVDSHLIGDMVKYKKVNC